MLYIAFTLMTFSLIIFITCFIIFCRYRNIPFGDAMAPLRFFDYCFFENKNTSNCSMASLLFVYVFGAFLGFIKMDESSLVISYVISVLSIILFLFHCRLLSYRRFAKRNGIEFLKEFFFESKLCTNNLLLWLARFLYIFWIYLLIL